MRVINLASGSDGNVTYIESDNLRFLVDAGLSCREIVKRLALIGVAPDKIDGIIITHEHYDHIHGVDVFSSTYDTPVYAHHSVWLGLDAKLKRVSDKNRRLFDGSSFVIGDMIINPVPLPHDVACFGFSFENNNKKISILTDLGHTTDRILKCIQGSQIVYLEANYDKNMLRQCAYPLCLKRRISGEFGHLSNSDSANAIANLVYTGTTQVILSHLSKESNTPDLAFTSIADDLRKMGIEEGKHVKIDVATRNPGVIFKLK